MINDEYNRIAASLKWQQCVSECYDSSQYWREIYLRFYCVSFPEGYVKDCAEEAFVQTLLTVMAYSEGFELNFWAETSAKERAELLDKAEAFYSEYCRFNRIYMEEMSYDELISDIRSWFPWAQNDDERQEPRAHILNDKAEELLNRFSESDAVWIGGSGNVDENWIAVQGDSVLFVNFRCSG